MRRQARTSQYDIVHGRQQREKFQAAVAESKGYGRTERRYLTDPPDAYREPAPTAPTEFEDIDTKKKGNLPHALADAAAEPPLPRRYPAG